MSESEDAKRVRELLEQGDATDDQLIEALVRGVDRRIAEVGQALALTIQLLILESLNAGITSEERVFDGLNLVQGMVGGRYGNDSLAHGLIRDLRQNIGAIRRGELPH